MGPLQKSSKPLSAKGAAWLLALTVVIFSTLEVVSQPLRTTMHPMQTTFLRFLIGGLFLLPFTLARKERYEKKDWLIFAGLGALNAFLSMSLLQASVFYGKASTAAILIASNPIFVLLLSPFLLREKMSKRQGVAVLLGVIGLMVIAKTASQEGGDTVLGITLGVLASFSFGLYTVLSKKYTQRLSSWALITFSSLAGCLFYLPVFALLSIHPFRFSPLYLPRLLYLGAVLSGISYITLLESLKVIGAGKGSMAMLCKPVLAFALAYLVLNERITPMIFLGSLCIVAGVLVNFGPEISCLFRKKISL